MLESIFSVLGNIVSAIISILPKAFPKRAPSDSKIMYENLRREIAEALVMYANCYHNPVDIAKTDGHQLPQTYREGSTTLRRLGSKVEALAETLPVHCKDMPVTPQQLNEASKYLIGLSNSFTTPYNCPYSYEDNRNTLEYEQRLKTILNLEINSQQKKKRSMESFEL